MPVADHDIPTKKRSTQPSVQIIRRFLKNPEEFLKSTRFDEEKMKKLQVLCQSRDQKVPLKIFRKSQEAEEIFREEPFGEDQREAPRSKTDITPIKLRNTFAVSDPDPITLTRVFPGSEEMNRKETELFNDIAMFRGSTDGSWGIEFLSRASGTQY